MSHELEIMENGKASMFYAGDLPWHRLGTRVETEITASKALEAANLNWKVEKRDLYIKGKNEVDGIPVIGKKAGDNMAVVRTSDEKILGVVGSKYQPIQNEEAFSFLDGLVGEGLAMFHTAGSLFGGKRIFITCKLPDSVQVGPDKVEKYLALATSHDGSQSMHVKWTPIRVVCWNTMSAAFRIYKNRVTCTDVVTIKHTKGFKNKISEARRILNLTDIYYKRVEETFNKLIQTDMSEYEMKQFSEVLYEPTMENEDGEKITSSYTENKRIELNNLFHIGIGNDNPDVKNTRWAALNAVTEQIDHCRNYRPSVMGGNENDARMVSTIWGNGSLIKKRALELLTH